MKKFSKVLSKVLITGIIAAGLTVLAGAEEMKVGIGTVNASSLNMRSKASTSSQVVASAPKGDKVVVIEKTSTLWYKVEYENTIGYMYAEYLDFDPVKNVELGYATAKDSSVNMRSLPSTAGNIVGSLPKGKSAYVIGFNNGWYKVQYNGVTGYIRSDLLSLPSSFACNGSNLDAVIAYAKQFLGTPYVWGGTTPKPGFDCSGFTQYVCRHFGVTINRVAVDQMLNGTKVSYNNLRVGDLVFFERTYNTTAAASHVGFYIGNGQFIHAANAGIKISSLSENYYATRYVGARRVF